MILSLTRTYDILLGAGAAGRQLVTPKVMVALVTMLSKGVNFQYHAKTTAYIHISYLVTLTLTLTNYLVVK